MISEKEIAEYKTLFETHISLKDKYLQKKQDIRLLLEKTYALKKEAFTVLARANRLTRHLTGRQKQIAGLSYSLSELKNKVSFVQKSSLVLYQEDNEKTEILPYEREEFKNLMELKQKGVLLTALIGNVKKNLLQLELLEMRCRELIISINKALLAFRYELKQIHRKLYPLGPISFFYRFMRTILGKVYFSYKDLGEIIALGNITCYVLKIADSSIV